ncbi:MAG: hypothetical protein JXA89_23000 [Anaerolineae bacterium]|nr:hypothetical protein [Anaerolineae bacterium]
MAKKTQKTWILILAGAIALILAGGWVVLQPYITPLYWVVRTAALLGYLCVFATALSSPYMKQLVRFFGRPFVKTHHIVAVTGLVLITVHPLAAAFNLRSPGVFVPRFTSWIVFLQWGGPVAFYLIGIAALAALLGFTLKQKWLRQYWRIVHMLNYVAFFLATAHAILLGSDFRFLAMKAVAIIMALVLAGTFVQKRLQRRPRAKKSSR